MRCAILATCLSLWLAQAAASSSQPRRPVRREYSTHNYYLLEHDPSSGVAATECASELGAELVEPVGELQDHWLLRIPISEADTDAGQDRVLENHKRLTHSGSEGALQKRRFTAAVKRLDRQVPRQRIKRTIPPFHPQERAPPPPTNDTLSREIAQRLGILDPLFPDQWHLVNEEYPEHMLNATPLWDMGITGEGVISALVDDGLEFESDDLADNFYAPGSHDFNDNDDLPRPRLSDDHHGTRCAGQIAAVKNGVCGVGVAYSSKVAGIRILSGPITDVDEAAALNFGYQDTAIYSCSWGPADDGRSMEAPNHVVKKAIVNGIQNGRNGKGSVFVFASGNGAYSGDQCNFDGYTNSIYSVTIGAVDWEGKHPYYSEACAANMVVTYSSGSNPKKSIVTTDMGKSKCSTSHGGTSAAAPNAAGIFALALSVRPDLSWRDIQHLCVQSAQVINPGDEDWQLTASGHHYNYKYGYGKLDAYDFVTAAQNWELVKPQAWIELPAVQVGDGVMDKEGVMEGGEALEGNGVESKLNITREMLEENNFEGLEHVTVRVWIAHTRRGDVEVELIGPNGVRSMLAGRRKRDDDKDGYPGWKFMSVKHWGENPVGEWTLRVWDQGFADEEGRFLGWQLSLWGSSIDPEKAKPYVLLDTEEQPFPPPEPTHTPEPAPTTSASTTKSYLKPTITPTSAVDDEVQPTGTSGVAPGSTGDSDKEWPTVPSNENSDMQFFVSIAGFVGFLLLLGGAILLIIRQKRMRRRGNSSGEYSSVPGSAEEEGDLRMTTLERTTRIGTRPDVIYDADEEMGLLERSKPRAGVGGLSSDNPVAFHSGFLDDDDDDEGRREGNSKSGTVESKYRDEDAPGGS